MMSDSTLTEIFRTYIAAGENPSKQVIEALAKASGKVVSAVAQHYVALYRAHTGTEEDPFLTPPMQVIRA